MKETYGIKHPQLDKAPAIRMQNVSFSYGAFSVLTGVNLTIDRGDFACLVGPNGGGKTTLVQLILGLLTPDTGSVEVLGTTPLRARARIGYTPQHLQFDSQFPVRAIDVVLMGRLDRHRFFGCYTKKDYQAAQGALAEVGMADLSLRPLAALSGGQCQRVFVARALVSEPELLVLDEPMANIDPAVQNELYTLLERLTHRVTILMVTHDIGFVSTSIDRVVCVNRTVWVHPTTALTGETIRSLYGSDVSLVRHDHRCAEEGHQWPSS